MPGTTVHRLLARGFWLDGPSASDIDCFLSCFVVFSYCLTCPFRSSWKGASSARRKRRNTSMYVRYRTGCMVIAFFIFLSHFAQLRNYPFSGNLITPVSLRRWHALPCVALPCVALPRLASPFHAFFSVDLDGVLASLLVFLSISPTK